MRFFVFILTIFIFTSVADAIEVGDEAPDFTLESLDNGTISLSDYKGKVVYLFFFGYACPFCETHAPDIQSQIYEKYSRDDVQVLGLDIWDGGLSGLASFKATGKGLTFPLLNNASSVKSLYNIPIQDYIVIVNQKGIVAQVHNNYPNNLDISASQKVIDQLLAVTSVSNNNNTIYSFDLKPNYPNPFNPETNIPFTVDKSQKVRLSIYDITGKLVKTLVNTNLAAGSYNVSWNALDDSNNPVSSGVYLSRLSGKSVNKSRRIILLK